MTLRTSITHPIAIAEIRAGLGMGRIGVTFCPGKKQANAFSGVWQRDLCVDLDAIADWGAAAVVTLIEDHELESLQVTPLGESVADRHMLWFHLPIPDVTAPDERFDKAWREAGKSLRAIIRDGFDVLVHCKGGLGRAGTIAARLLVELGWRPDDAIAAVRRVRPGAIETVAQERHVQEQCTLVEDDPDASSKAVTDRALGALLGLAIGDAVGTTLEFKPRDTYPRLTGMVGGGPFGLRPGEWTDDTAMAVALADSLIQCGELDERDLMNRFVSWWRSGRYSCTGTCFDIGITTREALAHFEATGTPIAGSTKPNTAGNGSLMRLAPVVLHGLASGKAGAGDPARRQSATTHGAPACLDACASFASILELAIVGKSRSYVMQPHARATEPVIEDILAGSWRGKHRKEIRSSGYVAHSLEAALWCVGRTASFRDAVLLAANLGEDADTTAAITGQLAGALYGLDGIPSEWLGKLAWAERIETMGMTLLQSP